MSHTTGQTKEDNQQSNSDSQQAKSDSHQPEPDNLSSSPKLSDADYEFLFNQLLEGIAHGWHDRRIIKFFQQLDERGQQAAWIDWLNRIRVELLKLPTQSKRQLGTMMIRLGELTQSATEVDQIGATSYRIGRELLFGNTTADIWEYVGSDLTPEVATSEAEVEQELSQRLPTEFSALGSAVKSPDLEPVGKLADSSTIEADTAKPANSQRKSSMEDTSDQVEAVREIDVDEDLSPENLNDELLAVETDLPSTSTLEEPANFAEVTSYDEDFEFELSSKSSDDPKLESKDLFQADSWEIEQKSEQSAEEAEEFAPLDKNQSPKELSAALDALDNNVINESWSIEETTNNSSAINMEQVMHLIQSDEELAQQISQKLNITPVRLGQSLTETAHPLPSINELDESSLELVESWFNLGLKHVSAGDFEKAIADWEKALDINPNLSEAWHNRGSALGRLGNYEAAVESFQNALAIDPNNYQAWNDRAHALYQLQSWLEAVDSWSNAIKLMPGNHLFWYNRGCALEQLEKWQDAIASYEKALEIKPDFQPGRTRYINLVADNSRAN